MAEESSVIVVSNVQEWDSHLQASKESHKPVVIDFTATWCGPCRFIAPIFAELAKKFADRVTFLKVDVDDVKEIAERYGITGMPTFIFLKDGEKVDELIGADKIELEKKVESIANQ